MCFLLKKKKRALIAGICFLEFTSLFLFLTENTGNTTLFFRRWNKKQYLEKQTRLNEKPVKLMERLLKMALVGPDTPLWLWGRGEIPFDFQEKMFLNTSLTLRGSLWRYRMETNRGQLPAEHTQTAGRWVLRSCLVFIYSFIYWPYLEGDLVTSLDTR